MQDVRCFTSVLHCSKPIIAQSTALALLQNPEVGVIVQLDRLAIGNDLSDCMGITRIRGSQVYTKMHEMNNPRLTLEDQLLARRPSPLHDASPQTLYLEKTLESQLDEIRLLEAAALTHEQTVEAIFSQNQTFVDEITIEHEDEVQELKGRISDLEALVGEQGAKISEQGAKIEILLAEHTKRQRLLPSEESAAPGVGAT